MLEDLTSTDFEACLKTPFCVALDDGQTYSLELTAVQEWGEAVPAGRRQPFALTFTHPHTDAYLPQQTYRLENDRLGTVDIFLVPLGPGPAGMRYEAIFS